MKKNIFKILSIFFIALLFSACEKKTPTEYAEIHWDRDTCERCKMILSDRKHTVQVKNQEDNKIYKFDDIGCAILWFKENKISWKDKAKIWITDVKTSKWIDARSAFYDTVHKTPMAYGFSANEKKESITEKNSEIIDFKEVEKRVLEKGR
ncbi:nitrous oxide reductase accessory protein NosL [Halarcobacter bivalviorum]|uniref:NosL domain-containing protein n=2 Tax=Arcobacteraceae TaxID=2808963 RepID=A0AAX2A4F5_9BACT|nr:nitrous oxide reductase accessory protein NosL [Halarcobacter bivalviorum]AXH12843.1 NosL domain-containing protein [Halarcobacter bivalviorum]RXK09032.1 hypothetical protein CRV05_12195 [Halarcobacter bivalviorum]